MMYLSKLNTLLFHPTAFFENKKEEKLFWSLLYFIILSGCIGLSGLLMRLLSAIDSHMDLELFQEFFSPFIVIFAHDTIYPLVPILMVALLTHGLFFGKEKKGISKTLIVFFYAQTPLLLFLLLNYLLLGLLFLPKMLYQDIPPPSGMWGVVIPIYSITPLIGIVWMSIISMKGISVLYGKTGPHRVWVIPIFITTTLLIIMILMGFFSWTGVSYDKLTTENLKISPDKTVFPSSDGNYSNYIYNDLGISFLFPSSWYVNSSWNINTTKTVKLLGIRSYSVLFYDPNENFYHSRSLRITASSDRSKSIETLIKKDIYDMKDLGYTLVNQSPIQVNNRTGTHLLLQRISSQQELSYFFYGQPITRTGEPKVRDIDDIIWIDANGMRYSFHFSSPVDGYEEYHQIFCDILNSTKFLN